jgi:hypothetical protein
MTPEQQRALQRTCEDDRLTGEERARIIMLTAANNVDGLQAIIHAWSEQQSSYPIRYVVALAAQRVRLILDGREIK